MSEEKAKFSLILFSGDFDKAMAALTLANGAAGQGMDVTIFFTFWGMNLLRRRLNKAGNQPLEIMFKQMMPFGCERVGLSKMNFGGIGPWLMKKLIRQKDGQTAADLFQMAMERRIRFVACEASLKLLGIAPEELIEYENLEIAGVDEFLKTARVSEVSLFI